MTAYLSKIATRFDGSGGDASSENSIGTQALMPSRATFSAENSTDFNFPPATFSNEFTYLDSTYSSDNETLDNKSLDNDEMLKPAPIYIDSSPIDSIRTLFYSGNTLEEINQEPLEQSKEIAPQKTISSKSKTEIQHPDENYILKPNNETGIENKISQHSLEIKSKNPHAATKSEKILNIDSSKAEPSENSQIIIQQSKDKTIQSVVPDRRKQKEQLSLELKPASKEKSTNSSFDTIGQKEMMKAQPLIKQLRPATKKQRHTDSTAQKESSENKIRIGSIRVEIIPAKPPKVKTRTQQRPQQKVALPSKASGNQNRFPLRFGLKQM